MIDRKMDERRKKRREERERQELEKYRQERPKIQQQFADLKRDLGSVSEEEWSSIPDIGDRSIKRQKKAEIYTPVPDTVMARSQETSGYSDQLDERQQKFGGFETPFGGGNSVVNLEQIGGARGAVLGVKLDQVFFLFFSSSFIVSFSFFFPLIENFEC
jgi:pre-mRNA-processing factor 6